MDQSEDEPPSGGNTHNYHLNLNTKRHDGIVSSIIAAAFVLWSGFFGDVFGHPKDLLDFKRPIVRSGPLSVF